MICKVCRRDRDIHYFCCDVPNICVDCIREWCMRKTTSLKLYGKWYRKIVDNEVKLAILKAYFNAFVLANIPDKNLKALHDLLENALKIGEIKGVQEAKSYLKNQMKA